MHAWRRLSVPLINTIVMSIARHYNQRGIWGRSQWGEVKASGLPYPSLSPFPPLPLSIPPTSFPYPLILSRPLPLPVSPFPNPFPFPPTPSPLPFPQPLALPCPYPSPFFAAMGLGKRLSSPSGSGQSPAAKRFVVLFEMKILHLWSLYLTCQRQDISEPAGRVERGEVRGQRKA